jgi:CTP:molybdopterin cytidylyltransferase MocA
MIAAIIIAAGASERMGYPKALLPYRGRSFLEGILDACYAAGVEHRVVVLGYNAGKILESIDLSGVSVAMSRDLDAGPIGSVWAGLASLAAVPVDAVLVWPVDRPHIAVTTVESIVDAFRSTHQPIVVPTYQGTRGHPVLFGRAVFAELLGAPRDEGARAVVHRDADRVAEVAVEDAAVLEDFNTPEDYKRLLRKEDELRGD